MYRPFGLWLWLVWTAPAFAGPQIFWSSDPVRPGEAVLLVGDGFGTAPSMELQRLEDAPGEGPGDWIWSGAGTGVEALQPSDSSVKFIFPASLAEGVYALRVATQEGLAVALLNAPVVYWSQGDRGTGASPGGWIRVFGRNIGWVTGRTLLSLTSVTDGTVHRLGAKHASTWDAHFSLPADLPAGVYRLHIYNGFGNAKAWAEAGKIEIAVEKPWPERVFDVRAYGAQGDGTADDTGAVLAALQAAGGQGGGTVFLPRGRYRLTQPLSIPRFVTLRGERRDRVALSWPDFEEPPPALIQGSNHFAIEDLTLYASNSGHVIAGDLQETVAGKPGHVRIQRVTVRSDAYRGHLKPEEVDQRFRKVQRLSSGGGDTLRLGGENLVITDNDIYGSGRSLFLLRPKGAYVARNRFYNGRWGWYCLSGVDGLIFEDNQIIGADLMATGGGINNLYGTALSQNVFFARNRLSLFHGWDREAMTSDAGGGLYYGTPREITSLSFRFDSPPHGEINAQYGNRSGGWTGAGVFILDGKGMGQFAQVERIDGDVVRLDRPWKVHPDENSIVTVTMLQQNYLFVDNEFTDASIALQYYGTSVNHVASGNRSIRTGGFYNSGRWYRHYQPSWYCQFLDNEILEGNVYRGGANIAQFSGEAFLGTLGVQKPPNTAPLALAAIHRRNHLYSNAHLQISGGGNRLAAGVRDVIVENNVVEHADVGLQTDAGVVGLLEHGNVFQNVTKASMGPKDGMLQVPANQEITSPAAFSTVAQ